MITFINDLRREGRNVNDAVREGAMLRLRPILMTGATTFFGLLPLLFATGLGSEVQRPLAAVVVGGLFTAVGSTLLVLPTLYGWFDVQLDEEQHVTTHATAKQVVEHRVPACDR